MNNGANQQETVILIEMYKTLPILWTFKTQHSKCEVSNNIVNRCRISKYNDKQSVSVKLASSGYSRHRRRKLLGRAGPGPPTFWPSWAAAMLGPPTFSHM